MGWRGIPSVALNFGERGDCHGWLVGEPHRGISLHVPDDERGAAHGRHERRRHGVGRLPRGARRTRATRPQGAARGAKNRRRRRCRSSSTPTCAACCCARRPSSRAASRSSPRPLATPISPRTAPTPSERAASQLLLDLLTPIAKSVPRREGLRVERARRADPRRLRLLERVPARGLAARSEAQQHPRGHDRHPGMDLLGRKVVRPGRARLRRSWATRSPPTSSRARAAGGDRRMGRRGRSGDRPASARLTMQLGALRPRRRRRGDDAPQRRLPRALLDRGRRRWQWLLQAAVAAKRLTQRRRPSRVLRGQALRRRVLDHDRAARASSTSPPSVARAKTRTRA